MLVQTVQTLMNVRRAALVNMEEHVLTLLETTSVPVLMDGLANPVKLTLMSVPWAYVSTVLTAPIPLGTIAVPVCLDSQV